MMNHGKHTISGALRKLWSKAAGGRRGKPVETHETAAEQIREARESGSAGDAGASNRERMIQIGRGRQQSGRQGQ